MCLALFTPIQKNRESFTDAILLNSKRVSDFCKDEQYPLTRTRLYYQVGDGERGGTWEFILSHYVNTVSTRLFEDETNPFIWMDVQRYKPSNAIEKATTATQRKWKVNSDAIIYAYDVDSSHSYVFITRGLSWVRLYTSHTVADLSRAFSTSSSLSKS